MKKFKLALTAKHAHLALGLTVLVGIVLRLIWAGDMEYKTDEMYMFDRVMAVGKTESWPWLGVASGVYIRNPGMSVWIFLLLGKLLSVHTPVDLVRGVMLLNSVAFLLLLYFVLRWVEEENREPWLWATAIAAVNPLLVLFHRKIWAQSVLPSFTILFLMSYWRRKKPWGAFFWGLIGAALGQVHMSGFFFAAAFFIWTLYRDRRNVHWRGWLTGSVVGGMPLIPWFVHLATARTGHPVAFGISEALQLKFWVFWMTDPLGFHLGNTLGVHHGNSLFQQLKDFLPEPEILGHPTYLMALCHLLILAIGGYSVVRALRLFVGAGFKLRDPSSSSSLALTSAGWVYGLMMTLATIAIRRYYLLITFPLEELWLVRTIERGMGRHWRRALIVVVICELTISVTFLFWIHAHGGSRDGDYGIAYRYQR